MNALYRYRPLWDESEDRIWSLADEELSTLVQSDLAKAGIPIEAPVRRVTTRRLRQAYPVYTAGYRENFDRMDSWVAGIEGLTTLGRQDLFAHDNTHHALFMANAAVDCLRDDGSFDREDWSRYRAIFETHVVED